MTIIYVAGPMSGIKDHNRPLFNMVAAELTEQGHSVLNPATLPDGLSQGQYMQICLPMVAVAHLIKKALQCGQRGHKDNAQDLQDIIDSAIRAKEIG